MISSGFSRGFHTAVSSETGRRRGGLSSKQNCLQFPIWSHKPHLITSSVLTQLNFFFSCLYLTFYCIIRHLCLADRGLQDDNPTFQSGLSFKWAWSHIFLLKFLTPLPPSPHRGVAITIWGAEGQRAVVCSSCTDSTGVAAEGLCDRTALCANLLTHHTHHQTNASTVCVYACRCVRV